MVDDHELFLSGLVKLLAEHVDVVGTARTGEEALDVVDRVRPDAVLMDLNLPGMSGVETTRRLMSAHPGLCVVILTVMADEDALMAAILAGAAGYLLKNAPIEDIVAGVRVALERRIARGSRARGQAASQPAPAGIPRRQGRARISPTASVRSWT